MKTKILVFADWYLPGQKGGGAVSAISNLIELFGDDHDFSVVTRDRDHADAVSYKDLPLEQWLEVGKAKVFYTSDLSLRHIRKRVNDFAPQVLYLNSFFSRFTVKVLLLRKLGLIADSPIVLAPRGELSPAALKLEKFRKTVYRTTAQMLKLYRKIIWQASSVEEKLHIEQRSLAKDGKHSSEIRIVPDVPNKNIEGWDAFVGRPCKPTGAAKFVFLARISPIKNLPFALDVLAGLHAHISLDLYGPIDNPEHWEMCQNKIRQLPKNIVVQYKGPISADKVLPTFSQYHFQLLPTQGENFGYVILEALASGVPVIISDQTPWRGLQELGVGWNLALTDKEGWSQVIQECVAMDQQTYEAFSRRARSYVDKWLATAPYRKATVDLFELAVQGNTGKRVPGSIESTVESRG